MHPYAKFIWIILFLFLVFIFILIYIPLESEKTIHQILYPDYYYDHFPEEYFVPTNKKKYHRVVKQGYRKMANSTVAILGLAYNLGEDQTHKLVKRLRIITRKFKDYRLVIYAADSDDHTYEILSAYARYNKKIILPNEKLDKTGLNRIEKMCKLRNYVSDVLDRTKFNPDYVMFQDCDLASALSLDGIAHSIAQMKSYDAIFANGVVNEFALNVHIPFVGYFYYDSFAFLEDPDHPVRGGNKAIFYGRGEPLIPVKSAFGGAAIYKYQVFKKYRYDQKKRNMCEHISFNRQLYRDDHKMAINPSFLLIAGRQGERFHKTSNKTRYGKEGYVVNLS